MTEIPKQDLSEYIGQEIIVKTQGREDAIVIEGIQSGWLRAYSQKYKSMLSILLTSKEGENSPKYFKK